jgi:predicted GIY-YIG superfamily endonuclease
MGKTITTYLIDGNPKGTQYVFISNKVCKMYVIPRSNLSVLNTREELQKPAFYILLGEDEIAKPKAYIGQTENFHERVKDHDYKKGFWQKALVFISNDAAMTKADVQYLEYLAIGIAKKSKQYLLDDNKQIPSKPNMPEYLEDNMNEFFNDIKFLCSFIGCNIFDTITENDKHLFYTRGRGCNAKGFYDNSGFTVLEGSIIAKNTVKSYRGTEQRIQMINEYTSTHNNKFILESNKIFNSPSTAADFCIGSSNDGWIVWKDKDGNTLDSVYRKQLD